MTGNYIIGIDEVGRGPLAGPVVVAALLVPQGTRIGNRRLGRLRDSKQLSEQKREEWSSYLRTEKNLYFAIAAVRPRVIERINISRAANRAALRAYRGLLRRRPSLTRSRCRIVLDGGLFLGDAKKPLSKHHTTKTIVRGDEKVPAIAMASIIAKVYRDRLMKRLAKKYPGYGFEEHKGYGTRQHLKAIARLGATDAHRLTFLSPSSTIKSEID